MTLITMSSSFCPAVASASAIASAEGAASSFALAEALSQASVGAAACGIQSQVNLPTAGGGFGAGFGGFGRRMHAV